ncbi:AbrB/MazE/SpoVT family DNA-binding domain-containing protein [Devosia sp. RR2S18]|uniref:AbrB/MazE/SpoVT family DNA-binding domain-containing protein n=1 Tax=Devosia rhizosphaerae TaxID=3049774 RepID=UPI0032EF22C0
MIERGAAKGGKSMLEERRRIGTEAPKRVLTHTTLKKAGGSLIMTVPAPARHALDLTEGTEMTVSVEGSRLIVEAVQPTGPKRRLRRPAYTLDHLLAECDFSSPRSEEEQAWIDAPPVGREIW